MTENTAPSFLGMADFGKPNVDPIRAAGIMSAKERKVESIKNQAEAKKLSLGSDEFLRNMATASRQENDLTNTQFVRDMKNLNTLQLKLKYGEEVGNNAHRFALAQRELDEQKQNKRTTTETLQDFGLVVPNVINRMIGSVAAAGASVYDSIGEVTEAGINAVAGEGTFEYEPISPSISQKISEFGQANMELRSDTAQAQYAQNAVEGELLRQDSEDQFQKDKSEGKALAPGAQKLARDFGNFIKNVSDDPIVAGDLVTEGVASMVPITAAVRVAGLASAKSLLKSRGMSDVAIETFVKTPTGKKFVEMQMVKAVPAVTAGTEGPGALVQAQQEILSMPEADLVGVPEYDKMRAEGVDHETAQNRMASNAGNVAGALGGSAALLTGRIGKAFEVNPLAVTRGNAAASSVSTIAKEGLEEGIQESTNQVASNVGVDAAGVDTAILEGVGESAAAGVLGGIGSAAVLQTPGVVASTAIEAGKATAKGAGKALEARLNAVTVANDKASPVGSDAQKQAATEATEAADVILTDITPEQITPNSTEPVDVVSRITSDAVYVPQEEAQQLADNIPVLADMLERNGKIDRHSVINVLGEYIKSEEIGEDQKLGMSLGILEALGKSKTTDSTEMNQALDTLPEDHPARLAHNQLVDSTNKLESSDAVKAARTRIEKLTSEDVSTSLRFDDIRAGNMDTDEAKGTIEALEIIGRYNPAAIDLSDYDIVLEQVRGLGNNPILQKSLETARSIVEEMQVADTKKTELEKNQDAYIKRLPATERNKAGQRKYQARSEVSKDILERGNSYTGGLSLMQHRTKFEEARVSGRLDEAQDALTELRNFAQSQINKIGAYNESSSTDYQRKSFDTYSGGRFVPASEKPYANPQFSNSVATAQDAHIDTSLLVSLHNTLLNNFGDQLGSLQGVLADGPLEVPALNENLRFNQTTPIQTKADLTPQQEVREVDVLDPVVPVEAEVDVQPNEIVTPEETIEIEQTFSTPPQELAQEFQEIQPEIKPDNQSTKVEVVEVDEVETEAQPERTLAGALPRLFKDKTGQNKFLETFKRRKGGSTLLETERPSTYVMEKLDTLVDEPNQIKANLNDNQKAAVRDILVNKIPGISEAIQKKIDPVEGSKPARWFKELSEGSDKVLGYNNALPLNFMTENEDGSRQLDPKIMEAGAMAAVEWIIESGSRNQPYLDDADISEKLGLYSDTPVTQQMRDAFNSGTNLQSVIDAVAQKSMDLIGVTPDQSKSTSFTQGIFRALAANMVEAFGEQEWINVEGRKLTTGIDNNGKPTIRDYVTVKATDSEYITRLTEVMKDMPDVFSKVFNPEAETIRHIGSAPKSLPTSQLRNRFTKLKPAEIKAVDRLQNTPFKINTTLVDLSEAVGKVTMLKILGYQDVDPTSVNVNHAESIKGKNQSLESGWNGVDGYVSESRSFAETEGSDLSDVPVYFNWEVSSTGRLFQQGPITPQGNKFAREVISATNAEIDLTNPEMETAFWLTIAQAADVSVEKQSHENSVNDAQDMMSDPDGLKPAVDMLTDWLETGTLDGDALAQSLERSPEEMTMKLVHGLVMVAKLNQATKQGGEALTKFKTSLALEADGKTDGPINAMLHMTTGAFTPNQIKVLAKGGLFFSENKMSLNDYIAQDKEDLYHVAAEVMESMLANKFSSSDNFTNIKEMEHGLKVLRVLDGFLPDFGFTPEELDIGRKITKNPLTTFLYGAGVAGISQKISDTVLTEFYKVMSEVADQIKSGQITAWQGHELFAGNPQLVQDMQDVMGMSVSAKGNWTLADTESVDMGSLMSDPTKATVPFKAQTNLGNAVQRFFGEPLTDAIDVATGGLSANMKLTQKASQMQALVFQDTYKRLAKVRHDERLKDGSLAQGQILSQKDLTDVFEQAMKVAPIYETDAQSFHISSADKYSSDKRVSLSFSGQLSSGATVPLPGDAGVKVSPYMTIGTGDGRMILNIYTDSDGDLDTSLAVFDGVELPADKIKTGSTQINKAVNKGWMDGNIYKSMVESFDGFLANLKMGDLSDETNQALTKLMQKKPGNKINRGDFESMRDTLVAMSNQSEARKNAMKRLNSWIDHMASADAPYESTGEKITHTRNYDPSLVSVKLNSLYQEELQRIEAKQTEANQKDTIQPATEGLKNLIEAVGENMPDYGVHKVTGDQLLGFVSEANEFSSEQTNLFWDILQKDPSFKEFTFFFGSPQGLESMRDEQYPDLPKRPVQAGQVFMGTKVGLIANASPETLLHEVLHAHTGRRLIDHYKDETSSPEYVRDAVSRLEDLMDTFQGLDFSSDKAPVREATNILKHQLETLKGNSAAQMSEFISWTLSNQNLIELGQRTKVYTGIQKIGLKVLNALKSLLGLNTVKGVDMFSNIRFNTEILVKEPNTELLAQAEIETRGMFEQIYGPSRNLDRVENRYLSRLQKFFEKPRTGLKPQQQKRHDLQVAQLRMMSQSAAEHVKAQGFGLNSRETQAFQAVHSTLMSGMDLNPSAMRQANKVFLHAVKNLKIEDFIADSNNADDVEYALAGMKHSVLTGNSGLRKSANGQSDMLATFMALGQVDDQFREILKNLKAPKDVEISEQSVDGALRGAANTLTNYLTRMSVSPTKIGGTSLSQIDVLSDVLSEIDGERRFLSTINVMKPIDTMNDYVSEKLQTGSEKASRYLGNKSENSKNKYAKIGFAGASLVTALGSSKESDVAGETLTMMLNHTPKFDAIRNLLGDLRGMTGSNAELMRLINVVKSQIDGVRQDYREAIPQELAKKFTRKLKKEEWSRLFKGIAEIDLSSIGRQESLDLIKDPTSIGSKIKVQEDLVAKLGGSNVATYKAKSKALAQYMVSREVTSQNLLRNADAIANLIGQKTSTNGSVTQDLVDAIDGLVSLYAYNMLDKVTKETLKDLGTNEEEGTRVLIGYHKSTKAMEIDRRLKDQAGEVSLYNGWKGYAASVTREGQSIIVADDSDNDALVRKGYTRVGDYAGDHDEAYRGKRGYYQSSVGGQSTFRQGVAQTVHKTWQGVDVRTGQSRTGDTSGVIMGAAARRAQARKGTPQDGIKAGEHLMPIYAADGSLMAYERPMAPERLMSLQKDTHMGRMMGVWSGRILEETMADKFNMSFVETMKEIHDKQGTERAKEFVNIADPNLTDKVIKDAWDTLGAEIKEQITEVFGSKDYFPVRRDMIKDAIGYRAASITDPFSGVSQWSETSQKNIVTGATAIFGKNAYKYMTQGEGFVTDGVSYAKTTIVIRSLVVMWENLISNNLHLLTWGIGPVAMAKGMRDKYVEISEYVKNKEQILALNTQLAADLNNPSKANRIKAQLMALEDANKRLSIKPLIDAGEFSTVSENLTEADQAIREGKLSDFMEKAVEKLPGFVQTAGKNILITKDTALFQGMNRMIQYGDFVAKAVLYDHLIKEKGMPETEVMDVLAEEFVNYNRLPGRGRDYLESVGLLWFYNYKLRIMKIAVKMMRERPLSALLFAGGLGPAADIDTVLSGSGAGAFLDGRLGYSVGPEMGLNAWTMNPWYNLTQ